MEAQGGTQDGTISWKDILTLLSYSVPQKFVTMSSTPLMGGFYTRNGYQEAGTFRSYLRDCFLYPQFILSPNVELSQTALARSLPTSFLLGFAKESSRQENKRKSEYFLPCFLSSFCFWLYSSVRRIYIYIQNTSISSLTHFRPGNDLGFPQLPVLGYINIPC